MRRFIFLLSSFFIGNPRNCKHKKIQKNKNVNSKHGNKLKKLKKSKMKNTKIKIKCVGWGGGGGNLHYLLCLISNTLPQLEQSSLHPQQFSVIASCYRQPATTISVFSYTSTAPVRSQKGLRPFNPLHKSNNNNNNNISWHWYLPPLKLR